MARNTFDRMFSKVDAALGREAKELRKLKKELIKTLESAIVPREKGQRIMYKSLFAAYSPNKIRNFPYAEIVDDIFQAPKFPEFEEITDHASDTVSRETRGLEPKPSPWSGRVDEPEIMDVFNLSLAAERVGDQDLLEAVGGLYNVRRAQSVAIHEARAAECFKFALDWLGRQSVENARRDREVSRAATIADIEVKEALKRGLTAGSMNAVSAHKQSQLIDKLCNAFDNPKFSRALNGFLDTFSADGKDIRVTAS